MDISLGTLFASLFVGSVGMGLFLYGKKQLRWPQLGIGLVLMVFPYFTNGPAAIWSIGGALVLALTLAVRWGA